MVVVDNKGVEQRDVGIYIENCRRDNGGLENCGCGFANGVE